MPVSTVSETLNAAADLLVKTGWCKKAMARNRNGHWERFDSPTACRFCARGAIARVAIGEPRLSINAADAMTRFLGRDITYWNDYLVDRRAAVVAKLREAAAIVAQAGK